MAANNTEYDHLLKFILFGDSGIGKSQILDRYVEDAFTSTFISTIGVGFKVKWIELQGKKIKLWIWDAGGQERFRNFTCEYLRICKGIMLVYDITDQRSFDNLPYWLEVIRKRCPDAGVLLVGNKSDLDSERVISKERGQHLASSLGISFRETSPKSDITSVDEAFETLVGAVLAKYQYPTNEEEEEEKKAGRCTAM